ncbi:MAG: phytoene/squalene synthase family protein [Candidatus Delongbacteria bacterium]|jgi:farnesyl-diphosphate farnesyltransferase|nr:phytoene/squalene synthase family protein [Candidatus Delongbacteria bacterium]
MDTDYYNFIFPKERNTWLKKVSRTFYLSIQALPKDLHIYVGHSYLICRLLDTLEDAFDITVDTKIKALDKAISCIASIDNFDKSDDIFKHLAATSDIKPYEKILLENSFKIFECIGTFPEIVQSVIRKWTIEMAEGMKKYAFGTDRNKEQLTNIEELEDYTYYVAGTVGELLSQLFTLKKFKIPEEIQKVMFSKSIAFGKALQYVNIIKDSREDFEEDRCFIPADLLEKRSISLDEFFKSDRKEDVKAIYIELIDQAEKYLDDAIEYINIVPKRLWKIRLFCIWPVAMAYATLNGVKKDLDEFIDTNKTYKISRKTVKSIVKKGYFASFSNWYFKRMLKSL